jgi:hypothetical protein
VALPKSISTTSTVRTPPKEVTKKKNPQDSDSFDDVTNEVNITVRNPVPLELENVYTISPGGNKYIPFLTATDDPCFGFDTFFNVLLKTRLESASLHAILESKLDFIMGDGIYVKDVDTTTFKDEKFAEFLKMCNSAPAGYNSVIRSVADAWLTFGNSPIEIVRGSTGGKKWLQVYAKNQLDCRKEWPNAFNECDAMIISRWFRKRGTFNLTQKYNIRIPFYKSGGKLSDAYWVEDKTDNQGKPIGKGVFRTALWLRNKVPGYDHYGLPSWIAGLINANLEYRGAVYNYDNLKNGMNIGGVLTVEGNLSEPERKKLAKDLVKTYTGVGHGGRVMVVASVDNINKSTWNSFNTHKDGSYIDLDKLSMSKLLMVNKWDGAFLGQTDGMSKSKSGAYMNELYQQKIKTVIRPFHRMLKDEFFTPLAEIADAWLGTKWSTYDFDMQIANLFNDTTEASTTVNGVVALTNILKLVGSGVLPHDNAIRLVTLKWGMSQHDAQAIINGIKVTQTDPANTKKDIRETE